MVFPIGSTIGTATYSLTNDEIFEEDEEFTAEIETIDPDGGFIVEDDPMATVTTVTIVDDDGKEIHSVF